MNSYAKQAILSRWVALSCSLMLVGSCFASNFRTFTNKEGVQIAAEFLEFPDEKTIRIRRISDSQEFLLEISNLGLTDQQFLAGELKKRAAATMSDSEGTLIVTYPDPSDYVHSVSTIGRWESTQIGARTARVMALGNTWICYWSKEFNVRFLIPYFGETKWKIETDKGGLVWLTRGEGEKELAGIFLPSNQDSENSALIGALDPSLAKNSLCLSCIDSAALVAAVALPAEIPVVLASNRKFSLDSIQNFADRKVIAVHGDISLEDLPELEKCSHLDFLFLKVIGLDQGEILTLPSLPGLQHLGLRDSAGQVEWDKALAGMPSLRSLVTVRTAPETTSPGTPITTFAANPALTVLVAYNRGGNYLSLDALKTAPGLRYLRIGTGDIDGKEEDYSAIYGLERLEYANLALDNIPIEEMDDWFVSGAMENLRDYTGYQVPLFENCPSLESIYLMRSESLEADRDFARFEQAPASLSKLRLNWVHYTSARKLNLPAPENLLSFESGSTTFPNPEFLYRFQNLTRLSVGGDNGGLVEIDVSNFPELTSLHLAKIEDLIGVDGITGSSKIAIVSIHNHPLLGGLGTAQTNESIHTVNISALQLIENLDTFAKITGCKRLLINNCDALTSYEIIEANNDLTQLSVKNCEKLPDVAHTSAN